jgi:hypothetical protein
VIRRATLRQQLPRISDKDGERWEHLGRSRPNRGLLSSLCRGPGWVGPLGVRPCSAFGAVLLAPRAGPSAGASCLRSSALGPGPLPRFLGPLAPAPGSRCVVPGPRVGGWVVAVPGLWPGSPAFPLSPKAYMCGRRDSNPHPRRDRDLNPARLPIPPRPRDPPERTSS